MVEDLQPIGEDFSKSIEDLAEHAGEVALEIYRNELNKGSKQTQAFSKAIDAAKNVMMDSGCPLDICDLLADAAIKLCCCISKLYTASWTPAAPKEWPDKDLVEDTFGQLSPNTSLTAFSSWISPAGVLVP